MLVTFQSPSYADITMFGTIAVRLLHLMGHSGTVPSAIQAEDIPAALERLKNGLKDIEATSAEDSSSDIQDSDEAEKKVSLATRALPLIKLLEAAATEKSDVMWNS
jgi:hypothetical protein